MATIVADHKDVRSTRSYEEMEEILIAQRESYLKEGFPLLETRVDRLDRMAAQVIKNADRKYDAINSDFGVRTRLISLGAEVVLFLSDYNYLKKKLPEWIKPEDIETGEMFKAGGVKVKILHQPLGVVGIVAPWNGPIGLSIGAPLGHALAAGNRVILKPSSKTPQTSALIKEMVEAAFDPTEVAVFLGRAKLMAPFAASPLTRSC